MSILSPEDDTALAVLLTRYVEAREADGISTSQSIAVTVSDLVMNGDVDTAKLMEAARA